MRSVLLALVLVSLVPGCKKESSLKDALDPKFRVGTRWSYWARPGEEQSTLTIEKVELHPTLGTIVHVGLDDLKLQKDKKSVGLITHLAFSREAIEKSATKMVDDHANIPQFQQEYEVWKKAVDDGGGSVIQLSVAEQLNAMEDK